VLISKTIWWVLLILTGAAGVFGIGCLKAMAWRAMSRKERLVTIALLSGLALCAMLYSFHRDVITCTESGGSVHTERAVQVPSGEDGTLIVNKTERTLQLVTVWYGMGGYGDPTPVPPGASVSWDDEVDNIGPGNPPPSQIRSSTSIDSRCWLTW
jgi:hypothetical protein